MAWAEVDERIPSSISNVVDSQSRRKPSGGIGSRRVLATGSTTAANTACAGHALTPAGSIAGRLLDRPILHGLISTRTAIHRPRTEMHRARAADLPSTTLRESEPTDGELAANEEARPT
ncbi:MAG: hypothetical protein CL908_13285 [Deltaproteobacteria bacterium]|jgi:hypothetical protein|nr:hypothetical protein [Deltaproteobacteria bacterium]